MLKKENNQTQIFV